MFKENEKSTFKYWFAHWCAYQMTALNYGMWKPKYLLHDIEKPWLMLIWKDYPRVKSWHRSHSSHHLENIPEKKYDWEAIIIDWECSRFTKESAQMNAQETMYYEMKEFPQLKTIISKNCIPIIKKMGIWK